jgi:hypothetical protein
MAFITADRVLETSVSSGTAVFTLGGTLPGFRLFSAVCATGDTFVYYAEDIGPTGLPIGDWEIGVGTWNSDGTIQRSTILHSSNGGSAVSWLPGTRRIAITLDASQVIANKYAYTTSETAPTPIRFGHIWTKASTSETRVWHDNESGGAWLIPNRVNPVFTGFVSGLSKTMVGLANVDNTSDANKPVSGPQQSLFDSKASIFSPAFSGTATSDTPTLGDNSTRIATTEFCQLNFAKVDSPAFTGAPTAPSPGDTNNTSRIATMDTVQIVAKKGGNYTGKINLANLSGPPLNFPAAGAAGLVPGDVWSNGSTLNFRTDSNTTLSFIGSLSPALVGTPTAPTPAGGDNSTRIATTAFVKDQGYAPLANPEFTGLLASGNYEANGYIRSKHPNFAIGYMSGAGGTVTQLTSKSTTVLLNRSSGTIITHNESVPAGVTVHFTVQTSAVAAGDTVILHRGSGGTNGAYWIYVDSVGSGVFEVFMNNFTGSPLSEAISIHFAIIKAASD